MKMVYFIILFMVNSISNAQYNVRIYIEHYSLDSVIISKIEGNSAIPIDTIQKSKQGYFLFKRDTSLADGVYYIGKDTNLKKFKMLISKRENSFEAYYDYRNVNKFQYKNSHDNKIYQEYFSRSLEKRNLSNLYLRSRKYKQRDSLLLELNKLRDEYIDFNRGTLAALVIKSEKDWIGPKDFESKGKERENELNINKIDHFLDNIELGNPISMRLPSVHKKIIDYFNIVIRTNPERVNQSIAKVFERMGYNSELYKYYLKYLLKKYNRLKDYWTDNTYVFLAEKYLNKRLAPWMTQKEIDFIHYQADNKKKTLVGKIIPDITLETQEAEKIRLLDIEADYTVLIFWRPGCSHCKHAMPFLNKVNDKYKNKGVKIVSVCSKNGKQTYRCWVGVKRENMKDFAYNLADKSGNLSINREFNIGAVPMIFILDKDKRIIKKKVNARILMEEIEKLLKE